MKSTSSLGRDAFALNSRTTSGRAYGIPSLVRRMRSAAGSRIRPSRRQIQASPSHSSRKTSTRQGPPSCSRTHVWWWVESVDSVIGHAFPSPMTTNSKLASASRTSANRSDGTPISRSSCSRLCPPRKRSRAQPAATHHGAATPARFSAASCGLQASHASRSTSSESGSARATGARSSGASGRSRAE